MALVSAKRQDAIYHLLSETENEKRHRPACMGYSWHDAPVSSAEDCRVIVAKIRMSLADHARLSNN